MKTFIPALTTIFLAATLISSCAAFNEEEVARLSINQPSTPAQLVEKEVTVALLEGVTYRIWSHLDVKFKGFAGFEFRMQVLRENGEIFLERSIDPMDSDVTVNSKEVSIGNKTSKRFTARNAQMVVDETGTYTIKAIFLTSENESLEVKAAELIITE